MKNPRYHRTALGRHALAPETLMLSYGYDPTLSEGAIKPPVFLTSTFTYKTAGEGAHLFDLIAKRQQPAEGEAVGLIYSRFNNPNLEVLEDRLAVIDGAEDACVTSSGMAAIATMLFAHLRPGDTLLAALPVYGGTAALFSQVLPAFGIKVMRLPLDDAGKPVAGPEIMKTKPAMIYAEAPCNPTNVLADISALAALADRFERLGRRPLVVIDNTLLGPLFQKPLRHGADANIYSVTKYIAGHSDLVAGAVTGKSAVVEAVRAMRGLFGCQLDPHSCWMVTRSLETVSLRMEKAATSAARVAAFLSREPAIAHVNYLGALAHGDPRRDLVARQLTAAGSTLSFSLAGGRDAAFAFLDALQVVKQAVSLGGTESLACHPASTTHSGISGAERAELGIDEGMVRLSVGIEAADDIIADLRQALSVIDHAAPMASTA